MKTLLITGANGQLGQALVQAASTRFATIACSSADLDITDVEAVHATLAQHQPDAVINAAAYTAVDKAETQAELARRVNVDGPANLAHACQRIQARLIHLSTDFVFDGQASTPYAPNAHTHPLSVYGASKRDGELAVQHILPANYSIVRTAWVYGPGGQNFVTTMLRLLAEREELRVVADQIGCPTHTTGLAKGLLALLEQNTGQGQILHHCDAGAASWYDFAVAIRELAANLKPRQPWAQVTPIRTQDYPTPAKRPAYSLLDCNGTHGLPIYRQHWRQALAGLMPRFLQ